MYVCYLLKSDASCHTYIGATLDPARRIRQHNGEIGGGAKYTRAHRPWKVHMVVSGFPDKRAALQFEWAWKHNSRRAAGSPIDRRMSGLSTLLGKERWTSNARPSRTMPLQLVPHAEALVGRAREMAAQYGGVQLAEPAMVDESAVARERGPIEPRAPCDADANAAIVTSGRPAGESG